MIIFYTVFDFNSQNIVVKYFKNKLIHVMMFNVF